MHGRSQGFNSQCLETGMAQQRGTNHKDPIPEFDRGVPIHWASDLTISQCSGCSSQFIATLTAITYLIILETRGRNYYQSCASLYRCRLHDPVYLDTFPQHHGAKCVLIEQHQSTHGGLKDGLSKLVELVPVVRGPTS